MTFTHTLGLEPARLRCLAVSQLARRLPDHVVAVLAGARALQSLPPAERDAWVDAGFLKTGELRNEPPLGPERGYSGVKAFGQVVVDDVFPNGIKESWPLRQLLTATDLPPTSQLSVVLSMFGLRVAVDGTWLIQRSRSAIGVVVLDRAGKTVLVGAVDPHRGGNCVLIQDATLGSAPPQ